MNKRSPHIKGSLIIVATAAIIGAVVVYYAASSLMRDVVLFHSFSASFWRIVSPLPSGPTVPPVKTVSLEFYPAEGVYEVGEFGKTAIRLRPQNASVAGVDIRIHYDPSIFEISDVVFSDEESALAIKDIDSTAGTIAITVLASAQTSWEKERDLGEIHWRARAVGDHAISFYFTPGISTDTNAAEFGSGDDILTSVINARYTITKE